MIFRHITKAGLNAERRCRGRVAVWNDSSTIELTMGVAEVKQLERRFFIDIEDIIPDDLMGKLLHHFKHEGLLLDEGGLRV
jgi:hypothetical protein